MPAIDMIAIDLDGTLFNHQKEVTPANRQALAKARARGAKVVITTGRPLAAIGNLLEELDLARPDDYSITFNGGLVQVNTGQILAKQGLSFEEIVEVHDYLSPIGLPVDILSDQIVYSIPAENDQHSRYHEANPLLTFVELDSLADLPRDIIYNKVVTVCEESYLDERLTQLPEEVYQNFEAFKSREIIFEIMPKGVHKAAGLQMLCDYLGISSERVMAIGDEANDVPMLSWAGLGVAMANAVPAAKAAADVTITRTNDESGVAQAIETYLFNE